MSEWMREWWPAVVLAIIVTCLLILALRRRAIMAKGNYFECAWRIADDRHRWKLGIGHYDLTSVAWYSPLSPVLRPVESERREHVTFAGIREVEPGERLAGLGDDMIVKVTVTHRDELVPVEVSFITGSATAFISWLQSSPPSDPYDRL